MPRSQLMFMMLLVLCSCTIAQHHQQQHPLAQLNPWLSACDLVHNESEDLQGVCMAGQHTCPPPCHNNTTNQCLLYLEEAHKVAVCDVRLDRQQRQRMLATLRLRHCCEHAVAQALRPAHRQQLLAGGAPCRRHLDALLAVDALAARISCEFQEVLTRYDCAQPYSIVYHCNDCKEAYRRWVCSNLVPHLTTTGGRVRPCRAVCQAVEQRCPYLLPGDRAPAHPTQYAGEPTFLCLDPNIPETGIQRERSMHGDTSCCYTYCGGPGRPPCVTCPRGASNTTWGPLACGPPGKRITPPCRPIAMSSSSTLRPLATMLVVALLLTLTLVLDVTDTALLLLDVHTALLLLTCCVCDWKCACARTPPHPHTTPHSRWTS